MNATIMGAGTVVSREQLSDLATPTSTRTHVPVAHSHVVDRLHSHLTLAGYSVDKQKYLLANDANRMFGAMDLTTRLGNGVGLSIGIQNSHDKKLKVRFLLGGRVWVCSNLDFSAEHVFSIAHRRNVLQNMERALSEAVGRLGNYAYKRASQIRSMQQIEVSDKQHDHIACCGLRQGVITSREMKTVLDRSEEIGFHGRTAWATYNAFTRALGHRFGEDATANSAAAGADRTLKLNNLFANDSLLRN